MASHEAGIEVMPQSPNPSPKLTGQADESCKAQAVDGIERCWIRFRIRIITAVEQATTFPCSFWFERLESSHHGCSDTMLQKLWNANSLV